MVSRWIPSHLLRSRFLLQTPGLSLRHTFHLLCTHWLLDIAPALTTRLGRLLFLLDSQKINCPFDHLTLTSNKSFTFDNPTVAPARVACEVS